MPAGIDDRAPDFAGAAEQRLELVLLAPADGPLQIGQILGKPLQHLENSFVIIDEDIAPHHWIRSGDSREIMISRESPLLIQ